MSTAKKAMLAVLLALTTGGVLAFVGGFCFRARCGGSPADKHRVE